MFKKTMIAITAGLLATSATAANYFEPEDAVEYRQALYQVMGAQTSVMGGMVRGKLEFDGKEIHQRAQNIAQTAAHLSETYFPETRGVEASRLSESAWSNMSDFKSKGEEFGQALQKLLKVSATADFDKDQARSAVGALVQGCKGCHEDYREKR